MDLSKAQTNTRILHTKHTTTTRTLDCLMKDKASPAGGAGGPAADAAPMGAYGCWLGMPLGRDELGTLINCCRQGRERAVQELEGGEWWCG